MHYNGEIYQAVCEEEEEEKKQIESKSAIMLWPVDACKCTCKDSDSKGNYHTYHLQ